MKEKDTEYEQFETRVILVVFSSFLAGLGLGTLLVWFRNFKGFDVKENEE